MTTPQAVMKSGVAQRKLPCQAPGLRKAPSAMAWNISRAEKPANSKMTPQSASATSTKLSARATARSFPSISMRSRHRGADLAEAIRRPELGRDPSRQHHDETIADVEEFVEIG